MINCKNCNTQLDTKSEFCNACGGKVIRNRLTFKNLFEHLSETFFNYDNKLLRTFIELFVKPEAVTDGYISGIRKRYVNPISFFGLSLTITGLSIFLIKKFYTQYFDFSQLFEDLNVPQMQGQFNSTDFLEYNSLFYFVVVPLFALMSLIIFFDKKYNFVEHLIIYIYSMSVVGIVSSFVGQLVLMAIPDYYLAFSIWFYVFMLVYHCYILKRIFKLSFGNLILRTLAFLVLFFITYIGISIVIGIILFATGAMNLNDFAPK